MQHPSIGGKHLLHLEFFLFRKRYLPGLGKTEACGISSPSPGSLLLVLCEMCKYYADERSSKERNVTLVDWRGSILVK